MILETERLYLRKLRQSDFEDLCRILQDGEVMYAYEHAFETEEVQEWLDRQLARYAVDGIGLWAVLLRETGEFVGQAGLTMQEYAGTRVPEIGYLLKKMYWQQGYATEAASRCRDYAFNVKGWDRVYAIIRDCNAASRRVAERVGMRRVDGFVKHYYGMDMPHDVYAVDRPKTENGGEV